MAHLCLIEKWAENLEEVTLSRWLRSESDPIAEGDLLCEMITDKVTFEYEAQTPGVLRKRYCPDNSVLPVGYAFALIAEADEPLPEGIEEQNRALLDEHRAKASLDLDLDLFAAAPASAAASRVRATPAARRVARELGVTVEAVAAALNLVGAVTDTHVRDYAARR